MKLDFNIGKAFRLAVDTDKHKVSEREMEPELGATGTQIFSGLITKDYNAKLTGEKAITEYDKMRKDGQVRGCLLAMKLPLRSAKWRVEPASDSSIDKEIAEMVEKNLFEKMTITWDDTLRQILLMLEFGFMNFEKVYKEDGGLFVLKKLAPRLPSSHLRWEFDNENNLTGWTQTVYINEDYKEIKIPIEKLVVYSYDQEGQNYEGQSVLRSAWKNWYLKDGLYRVAAIGLEKNAVGLPKIKLPKNATANDKAKAKEIGLSVRVHDKAYIVYPEGFEIDVLKGEIKGEDLLKVIQYHDSQIAKSMLAQFIDLGTNDKGSYALSSDKTDFFLMSLKSLAAKVEEITNRFVIRQWVDFNYNVKDYPRLVCGEIAAKDKQALATALKMLADGRLIKPDFNIEDEIRRLFNLPEKTEEDKRREEEQKKNPPIPPKFPQKKEEEEEEKLSEAVRMAGIKWRRDLTPQEKRINFAEINSKFEIYEEKFKKEARDIIAGQSERLISDIERIVTSGTVAELRSLSISYQGRYSAKLKQMMEELYRFGKASVIKEIGKKTAGKQSQFMSTWIATKSETVAEYQASMLKTKAVMTAMNSYSRGKTPKQILWDVRRTIGEFAQRDVAGMASVAVGDAVNEGRWEAADEFFKMGKVNRAQYSAILDQSTCELCERLDGMVVDMNDPEYETYTPPIHQNCRCIWAYIDTDDTTAVVDWKAPPSSMVDKHKTL